MTAEEMSQSRLRFLNAVYESTGGDPTATVDCAAIGRSIGLSEGSIEIVATYLIKEKLLANADMFGGLSISAIRMRVVERGQSRADRHALRCPSSSDINVGTMTNSTILQSSPETVRSSLRRAGDPEA